MREHRIPTHPHASVLVLDACTSSDHNLSEVEPHRRISDALGPISHRARTAAPRLAARLCQRIRVMQISGSLETGTRRSISHGYTHSLTPTRSAVVREESLLGYTAPATVRSSSFAVVRREAMLGQLPKYRLCGCASKLAGTETDTPCPVDRTQADATIFLSSLSGREILRGRHFVYEVPGGRVLRILGDSNFGSCDRTLLSDRLPFGGGR